MITLELYSKEDCSLCERAKSVIRRVQQQIPFDFSEILIVPGTPLETKLRNDIPVLHVNGTFFARHFISETELVRYLTMLGNPS
jgi:hypothetical protein